MIFAGYIANEQIVVIMMKIEKVIEISGHPVV